MTTIEGGRHGVDSSQPLDPGDWAGLPDLSNSVATVKPLDQDLVRVPFTWISETLEDSPSFRIMRRSDEEAQG